MSTLHKVHFGTLLTILFMGVGGIGALFHTASAKAGDRYQEREELARFECNARALKGTYSFDAVGYAPALPPGLFADEDGNPLVTKVTFSTPDALTVIPLHAIGHVTFDGRGNALGYIHENVGGVFEDSVPFHGTYELAVGPNGVGCQGTWILQDDHRFFPFSDEPQHSFKITLAPESKGFHFIHRYLGADGQATLSGWAPLAYK